jgi:molybdopterin/thiamine biosynthesis adenylyltransferase
MEPRLEADILAASQPLQVPGRGEQRVLSPLAVERLAEAGAVPRWTVEAVALESGVTPLRDLRNLARFEAAGQVRLLRSCVAAVGSHPVTARVMELLALDGVGRLIAGLTRGDAADLTAGAANRNTGTEVEVRQLALRSGNPAAALEGADVVVACLTDSADEQLLQFACRMRKLPLVLGGVEENRGQATTVFPGDAGTAEVYNFRHPHLEPRRADAPFDEKAVLVVAGWLAEQVTAILLDKGDLLRGRLQYADLETGEMTVYPL